MRWETKKITQWAHIIYNIIKRIRDKQSFKNKTHFHISPKIQLFFINKNHLVRRKGIIIPAPVATRSKITWRTVRTTLISFTTNARALLLSRPSRVTYCWCCCCWCSIFQILVWQLSSISCMSLKRSSLWYWTFSSMSVIVCLRFSTSFWWSSVRSFICSSKRSHLKRSSCSAWDKYVTSRWRVWKRQR